MVVRFTVNGSDKAALEEAAAQVLASFSPDEPKNVGMIARPMVHDFGTQTPGVWEAEVEASF